MYIFDLKKPHFFAKIIMQQYQNGCEEKEITLKSQTVGLHYTCITIHFVIHLSPHRHSEVQVIHLSVANIDQNKYN